MLNVQSTLEDRIRKAQGSDKDLMKIRKHTGENKAPEMCSAIVPCATADEESGSSLKFGSCVGQHYVLVGTRKSSL